MPSDLSFSSVSGVVSSSEVSSSVGELKVYEKLWLLGDPTLLNAINSYVEKAYYYDVFGRVVQVVERDPWGTLARLSIKYDRLGNVLVRHESRNIPLTGSSTVRQVVKTTVSTYDSRGRLLSEATELGGAAAGLNPVPGSVQYSYDELGRLKSATLGDGVQTSWSYTTQGWGKEQSSVSSSGAALFTQSLEYQDCGLVETVTSRQGTSAALSFGATYDKTGRMTEWSQSGTAAFAEKSIAYDSNGNVLTLKRYGPSGTLTSDYSYTYSGNRLTGLANGSSASATFSYDPNGNMISDSRLGIRSVTYNEQNLPESVTFTSGSAAYIYLSDGTKLAALKNGAGYVYCGSMVFSITALGAAAFESSDFSGGRMVMKEGSVVPEYHVNDYLCSVRVVTDADGEVLERNDYSGFGKRLASSTGSTNRYRFSGKEEQSFAGLAWQDFGARMYDPDLARWTTQDPLANQYPGISPYAYCNNNPVNYIDPDGEAAWKVVVKGFKAVRKAIKTGQKVNLKKILESEALDIIEDAKTISDPDAYGFEKVIAVADLITGLGDEV